MPFCPQCGKAVKEIEKFCSNCGENLKEFLEEVEEKAEKKVKKTSNAGLVVFILIIALVGYICLDVWAIQQVTPKISLDNLGTIISNANGDISLSSTSASTKISFENPTFIPIIAFPMTMKAGYDNTDVIEGKTGLIFIGPNSDNEIYFEIKISHLAAGTSALKGIWNTITGNDKDLYAEFYELGIKFAEVRK